MKFNDVFNKYLKLTNTTSKEIAEKSKISQTLISRYKTGNRIPNKNNIEKIALSFELISNKKYLKDDILKEFNQVENISNVDFDIVINNLNTLVSKLNINASSLSKYLKYDPSYLSKIRNKTRIPANKDEFVDSLANFINQKYNNEKNINELELILNNTNINLNKIKLWLITNKEEEIQINSFLTKMDEFNLDDYIKAIKFDKLKVPTIPFYKGKSKDYYGLEQMKLGEIDFFKSVVLNKSMEDIFMHSDMPMEDMAKDIDFGKKWMMGIAFCLKKGLNLNIIHNLDRPFNELMLGLESWIPIYMTGSIRPYYFKEKPNEIYQHLLYVGGNSALVGQAIKGHHENGRYFLTNKEKEVNFYKIYSKEALSKALPLMQIYNHGNMNKFFCFIKNIKNEEIKVHNSLLPFYTMSDGLLSTILKRNNIDDEKIKMVVKYKNNFEKIIDENRIEEHIYWLNEKEFKGEKHVLTISSLFLDEKIYYTYDDYLKHVIETKKYKNIKCITEDYKTFKNIDIYIISKKTAIIYKSNSPVINFVIKHPTLVDAIDKFDPIVKE